MREGQDPKAISGTSGTAARFQVVRICGCFWSISATSSSRPGELNQTVPPSVAVLLSSPIAQTLSDTSNAAPRP
jgi:hypothetical protein